MLKRIKNRKNWMPPKIENKVVPATGNRRFFFANCKKQKDNCRKNLQYAEIYPVIPAPRC